MRAPFGKAWRGPTFGEVLHQVPRRVLGDDTLRHPMRPQALFVELGRLDAFGQPHSEVIVHGPALLEFGGPQ